ncbi:hypothetical protein DFH27DRAFT_560321 [Peziza echinospora]|nr:hypothetical protein DFH27DRAFT_560321 [Peziza echinospora]
MSTTSSTVISGNQAIPDPPRPKYVYKLIPHHPNPNTSTCNPYGSSSPKPPSFPIPPSSLDISSGFLHLCTHEQILGVMTRFMSQFDRIWILRVDIASEGEGDVKGGREFLKWEAPSGGGGRGEAEEEVFPHLYPPAEIVGGKWALSEKRDGGIRRVPGEEEEGAWVAGGWGGLEVGSIGTNYLLTIWG